MLKAKDSLKTDHFVSDGYKIRKTGRISASYQKIHVTCSIFSLSASMLEIYLIWRLKKSVSVTV